VRQFTNSENLTRRTLLCASLADPYHWDSKRSWEYPIPEFGGIYSKDLMVIRGSEAEGYPFFASPQFMSVISAAGTFSILYPS
jgi:hypothetical protein